MADLVFDKYRKGGGFGVAPDDTDLHVSAGNTQAVVTWSQGDTIIDGQVICHAKGVMIRRGTTEPATELDGDLVIDSTDLSGTYTDTGLTNKTTYFYKAFPYSHNLVYNRGGEAKTVTPDEAAIVIVTFTASKAIGMAVVAELNGTTYTETIGSDGTATFKFTETGTASIGGIEVEVATLGDTYNVTGYMFACHYSESNSDPASVTYPSGYDNYGWTAFAMNLSTGIPSYGSWTRTGKAKFLFPKSCMLKYTGLVDYYLNEDDETKKEDGTASDVANSSYAGNAMMEWSQDNSRISWIIIPDSDNKGWTFVVANMEIGSLKPWNLYDAEDEVTKHWYTPKYFGGSDGTRLRSISGLSNYVSNTAASEIALAIKNNTGTETEWYTEVWCDRVFLIMLCYLLGKTLNTQAAFGYGRCSSNNSSAIANGTMNGKGMFYGVSNQTSGVKVFGMENVWGNLWRRTAGLVTNGSSVILYKMTIGRKDGSTTNGYNTTGSGYINSGVTPGGSSGGYISHMLPLAKSLIPATASGSSTTYYADGLWYAASCYAICGGRWVDALLAGAACVALSYAASGTYAYDGACVSCKPLASRVNAA